MGAMPLFDCWSFFYEKNCERTQKYNNMSKYTYKKQFGIVVICSDEQEQKKLYERLQKQGLTLKVVCV